MGETEEGHRCYHVECVNGKDIDVIKLPSNCIEGEIKWIRIKIINMKKSELKKIIKKKLSQHLMKPKLRMMH